MLSQAILGMLSATMDGFFEKCYSPLGDLMDDMALINSSINFVIYYFMSTQFRKTFVKMFGLTWCRCPPALKLGGRSDRANGSRRRRQQLRQQQQGYRAGETEMIPLNRNPGPRPQGAPRPPSSQRLIRCRNVEVALAVTFDDEGGGVKSVVPGAGPEVPTLYHSDPSGQQELHSNIITVEPPPVGAPHDGPKESPDQAVVETPIYQPEVGVGPDSKSPPHGQERPSGPAGTPAVDLEGLAAQKGLGQEGLVRPSIVDVKGQQQFVQKSSVSSQTDDS